MEIKGRLYGIGVGPGDPELLTLKALRLLQAAPVVAYQSAVDKESIARAIVSQYLTGNQIEVLFHLPRALEPETANLIYDKEVAPIAEHLAAGRDVVVLCEGDPFFYGSFMYVFTRLSEHYQTEVVPGISSLMACPVALGVPFTYYNDIMTVLPAPMPAEELITHLLATDAAAIMKLGRHFTKVRDVLHQLGLASRALYIERATMTQQRIVPLDEVDPAQVPYFSMIIIPTKNRL
ncbi:precorrin-2 C(20)-methyltransferase [Nodularia spumigena CS-584]|jgi:precorrin-2/cobalt-factor-2 C20-methyltransferase|uniref:Precorrin-2 C(20)-methyltransferase n=1 Tax=Nodularia spumigena UHCC 0060 TaxID=3110300 RepID=A0ABU5USJ7_NODSP|nr:precorrin-2 C(20)-methyltransferase [Nodularia spumigena]AHJ31099.1 Cobalt-precorrin-2 C20-methyltransferase [Nodularia spumigena CCY9414]EAW43466.1 cobalamin biosynthesis precorrin-2 methyltransferase [Nodularia spumigena CCY9414]MDB9383955.1 precorrin-2 C(20)-methyltransferase [Nodularia spumigena CS-584]MEA5527142.1 precorrin-2 C(20)-methyltransferase [Nodularia spumigena UHCC 0143]MEA5555563.1 precorrin-2 C(20)-methyltransferase [Nodularia spumigena CH309]